MALLRGPPENLPGGPFFHFVFPQRSHFPFCSPQTLAWRPEKFGQTFSFPPFPPEPPAPRKIPGGSLKADKKHHPLKSEQVTFSSSSNGVTGIYSIPFSGGAGADFEVVLVFSRKSVFGLIYFPAPIGKFNKNV